jgi:pimeloyl-ACP methyl ester carboxylesterase
MEKQVQFKGQELSYVTIGHGPAVMLVHGFGEDRRIWQETLQSLSKEWTVICPDLPGSGRSPLPDNQAAYERMEDFADALLCIIQAENLQSLTMIGHSMGGYITLAFAEQYPGKLDAIGLFHSTARADPPEKIQARQRGIEFTLSNGAGRFLSQAIPNLYATAYTESFPDQINSHITDAQAFTDRAIVTYYQAMMRRPDRTELLQSFAKPVLFIMGEEDKTVLLPETLSQCYLPKESHVHIWKEVAHMGMKEYAEDANAVLTAFLRHVNENLGE